MSLDILLKGKMFIQEVGPIMGQISNAMNSISSMQSLASQGIMSNEEVSDLVDTYRTTIKDEIQRRLESAGKLSEAINKSAKAAADSKLKGMTPMIQGLPTITPLPPVFAAQEAAVLAEVPQIVQQLTEILDTINSL